jgi:hypothetical protein
MTSFHDVYPNTFAPPGNVSELDTSEWRWSQWLGADSLAFARRPDGAILIFCGDTYTTDVPTGTSFPADSFTNNSLLYWIGGRYGVKYSAGTNIFDSPNPYIPNILSPAGFRWVQSAWVDTGTDGKVHAMATEYSGNIFAGYTAVNLREYIINDDFTIASSALVPGLAPQTLTSSGYEVRWGHSVNIDYEAGVTYIFGTIQVPSDGARLVVCRRGIASGSLPGNTPTFWTGSTWSSDMQDVVELGPTPGQSLSVIRHPAGGWLCTSCRKGLLTNKIAAWYASTITGTWTDLGDIYTIPSEFTTQYNYGGLSYITENNKLRLMYNLNATNVTYIQADYRRYGIRWVEVEIPGAP